VWQVVGAGRPSPSPALAATSTSGRPRRLQAWQRVLPATASASAGGLLSGDFSGGFRYEERSTGTTAHLHVVSIGGAVTATTPADAGAQDGVTITLADGRTATVRFNRDAIGGHLTVSGGAGSVDRDLGAGIADLPELE
jgi:hypothetical protein